MSIVDGLIGAGATAGIGLAVWVWRARGDIANHDRLIRERNQDLDTWLADEQVWFQRRLERIDKLLAARGMLDSGERPHLRSNAAERVLHRWRDQERQAHRFVDDLRLREGWPHAVWRKLSRRQPQGQLRAPEAASPLLDYWRSFAQSDPTARTLAATVRELAESSAV